MIRIAGSELGREEYGPDRVIIYVWEGAKSRLNSATSPRMGSMGMLCYERTKTSISENLRFAEIDFIGNLK